MNDLAPFLAAAHGLMITPSGSVWTCVGIYNSDLNYLRQGFVLFVCFFPQKLLGPNSCHLFDSSFSNQAPGAFWASVFAMVTLTTAHWFEFNTAEK